MYLRISQFNKLPKYYERDDIRISGGKLYKNMGNINDEIIAFLKHLASLEKIPGVVLPDDILTTTYEGKDLTDVSNSEKQWLIYKSSSPNYSYFYEDGTYGYVQTIVKDSIDLEGYLMTKPTWDVDTCSVIPKMFESLDKIHKSFVIGDIKNSNILLTPDQAYFIDLENGFFLDNPYYLRAYYTLATERKRFIDCPTTDNIKALISSICLYYLYDLEDLFRNYESPYDNVILDIDDIFNRLKSFDTDPKFIKYLQYLINKLKNKEFTDFYSDTKFLQDLENPSYLIRKKFRPF